MKKPVDPKPITLWACFGPKGWCDYSSISSLRAASIEREVASWSETLRPRTWKDLKREGWRCHRILITAVR